MTHAVIKSNARRIARLATPSGEKKKRLEVFAASCARCGLNLFLGDVSACTEEQVERYSERFKLFYPQELL